MDFYDRVIHNNSGYNPFYLARERIDEVSKAVDDEHFCDEIDNVIELYNCVLFINGIKETDALSQAEQLQYKEFVNKFNRIIGKYFSLLSSKNFTTYVEKVHPQYVQDFWHLLCKHKKVLEISEDDFQSYLRNYPNHIDDVLTQKELAKVFSNAIYSVISETPEQIRIIVSHLLEKRSTNRKKLYLKEAFTKEQLHELFKIYIHSPDASIMYMKLIRDSQNDLEIGLNDNVRLLAKRREAKLAEELFNSEFSVKLSQSIGVSFGDYNKVKELTWEQDGPVILYDSKWIDENRDYPTILNNFIYLFEFADIFFRSQFPINCNQISTFEDVISVKGKNTYKVGQSYNNQCALFSLTMRGYYACLTRFGLSLEDTFKWFFEEYLPQEFSVTGFVYNSPSQSASYLEKCKLIVSEIESVLKQYRLFSENGVIDRELFEMSSGHLFFSELKSLNHKKYIYAKSNRVKYCIQHLFMNSMLSLDYDDCGNFFEVLQNHGCVYKKDNTRNYFISAISQLIELGVIEENDDRYFLNDKMSKVLYLINEAGVLCYSYAASVADTVDELIQNEDLSVENTLFSKQEQDYLDYVLNKAKFSDGLDLRNRYSHGTNSNDEKQHIQDYMEFLKIMVLIIIKINEEFCLKYPIKSNQC